MMPIESPKLDDCITQPNGQALVIAPNKTNDKPTLHDNISLSRQENMEKLMTLHDNYILDETETEIWNEIHQLEKRTIRKIKKPPWTTLTDVEITIFVHHITIRILFCSIDN